MSWCASCDDEEIAILRGAIEGDPALRESLSQHASRVYMLVRGPSLAASMSRYLIDRIEATPNIELRPHTEITRLHGDAPGGLAAV